MHLVEQPKLGGQLVGLLPLGGELGALLVVVVVRELLVRVGVPSEGPEAVQVDLIAHGRGQRVHQDARAQPLRGQLLGLPVPVEDTVGETSAPSVRQKPVRSVYPLSPLVVPSNIHAFAEYLDTRPGSNKYIIVLDSNMFLCSIDLAWCN